VVTHFEFSSYSDISFSNSFRGYSLAWKEIVGAVSTMPTKSGSFPPIIKESFSAVHSVTLPCFRVNSPIDLYVIFISLASLASCTVRVDRRLAWASEARFLQYPKRGRRRQLVPLALPLPTALVCACSYLSLKNILNRQQSYRLTASEGARTAVEAGSRYQPGLIGLLVH